MSETKPKEPRKTGRPPKVVTDEHLEQIAKLAGYGLTEAAIAHIIGMSPSTFREKKTDPRVSGALEKGKARAEQQIGEALFNKALGGDLGAIVWWEKTRAGRTDRTQVEHSGPGGEPVRFSLTLNGDGHAD